MRFVKTNVFVMTKVCFLLQNFCHDEIMFISANNCRDKTCHDKKNNSCDKHNFVATSLLCLDKRYVLSFVATKFLSQQKYLCQLLPMIKNCFHADTEQANHTKTARKSKWLAKRTSSSSPGDSGVVGDWASPEQKRRPPKIKWKSH